MARRAAQRQGDNKPFVLVILRPKEFFSHVVEPPFVVLPVLPEKAIPAVKVNKRFWVACSGGAPVDEETPKQMEMNGEWSP